MADKMTFDFSGFTQPEVNKPKPKKQRKSRSKKSPKMYSYGSKNKKSDYKLPYLNETSRTLQDAYYNVQNNSLYNQKHKESIAIAEAIIADELDNNDELTEVIDKSTEIRHTMSDKGWNITFKAKEESNCSISILCMFQPNYIRKYRITVTVGNNSITMFNDEVDCEKTIVSFPDDIPQI